LQYLRSGSLSRARIRMRNRLRWVTDEVPIKNTPDATRPTPTPITYRLVMYRPVTLMVFFVLGLVGVALVLNLLAAENGPPAAFVVLWLAAYA
jgi:hypothetical protein